MDLFGAFSLDFFDIPGSPTQSSYMTLTWNNVNYLEKKFGRKEIGKDTCQDEM